MLGLFSKKDKKETEKAKPKSIEELESIAIKVENEIMSNLKTMLDREDIDYNTKTSIMDSVFFNILVKTCNNNLHSAVGRLEGLKSSVVIRANKGMESIRPEETSYIG